MSQITNTIGSDNKFGDLKKALPGLIINLHSIGENESPFVNWPNERKNAVYRDIGFFRHLLDEAEDI